MTLPRTVAEILRDHVTLEVEGIDRMYLNAVVRSRRKRYELRSSTQCSADIQGAAADPYVGIGGPGSAKSLSTSPASRR